MRRLRQLFGKSREELWCHACDRYVQFTIDNDLDGNHVLECPNCRHEHCRVVKDGKITDIRWDQRNGDTYQIAPAMTAFTIFATSATTTSTNIFLAAAWTNAGTTS